MKILLLGGYGVFGGRLAELLADTTGMNLLICGRNGDKAKRFCEGVSGQTKFTPLTLDRVNIAAAITQHHPDIVIDASGPFQDYGDDPYLVVKACIAAKTHYLDFADAADFVFGISQFDAAAKEAGVFVLSGASSFPVLTAAVLRRIATEIDIVDVVGGIAPSPYAGIGLNVIRAVVGYAGGSVKIWRGGAFTTAFGLAESRRYTIAPPGYLPLRNIHFSLLDVPDLQIIPPEHPTLRDIWMGVGTVPEFLHRLLNLLAKARAVLKLPSIAPLSPLFYRVLNLMKFGEHRGGMFVHAKGLRDGQPAEISWHLLAEGDDGPYIPSMAIVVILEKLRRGDRPEHGARAATLALSDYDAQFERRAIYTGFRRSDEDNGSLYQRTLGEAFHRLPQPLQQLHNPIGGSRWQGSAQVTPGTNPIARLLARIIGFPSTAGQVTVALTFTVQNKGELWERNFGGKTFSSFQSRGTGRSAHLLNERFGPFTIALAVVGDNEKLSLIPRRWCFLGIPLPKRLLPNGTAFETVKNGKFCFNVEIKMPVIGLLVAYAGTLSPKT